jgi:hypothetical protein
MHVSFSSYDMHASSSSYVTALQEKFRTEKEVVMATLWDEALLRLQDVQEKMQVSSSSYDMHVSTS